MRRQLHTAIHERAVRRTIAQCAGFRGSIRRQVRIRATAPGRRRLCNETERPAVSAGKLPRRNETTSRNGSARARPTAIVKVSLSQRMARIAVAVENLATLGFELPQRHFRFRIVPETTSVADQRDAA